MGESYKKHVLVISTKFYEPHMIISGRNRLGRVGKVLGLLLQ